MIGIKKEIAEKILFVGIDYKNPIGGVAAVEYVYSQFINPFNFVRTVTASQNKIVKAAVATEAVVHFLWKMLSNRKIRIVHIHGSTGASFWRKRIFINLAKRCGKKVVWHIHGGNFFQFYSEHTNAVNKTMGKCDAVITLSDSLGERFCETFPSKKIAVIKNVVEEPQIEKHKRKEFSLLFLGLICKNKGIFDLLEVLAEGQDVYRGRVKLLFGGNGESEKAEKYIKQQGIDDIAQYVGWVSGDKKRELLNSASALVLPSYIEALPICILEAMSYGLPIIATRVGGIPDIVKDGKNGILIEPNDKQALGAAINLLAADSATQQKMGRQSASMIEEYLPQHVAHQLEALYRNLLS